MGPLLKPMTSLILSVHYRSNMHLTHKDNYKRILIVAPHADDETIGAGGTILKHHEEGAKVNCLVVTDGSRSVSDLPDSELIRRRKAEMDKIKELLHIHQLFYLHVRDGEVTTDEETCEKLYKIIQELKPELIYCPTFVDAHRDHTQTTMLLAKTLKKYQYECDIRMYEINCAIPPKYINVVIDVSDFFQTKKKALKVFTSQVIDFSGFIELSKIKTSLVKKREVLAVETFLQLDYTNFIQLFKRINNIQKSFDRVFKQINRKETLLWAIYKNYNFKKDIYKKLLNNRQKCKGD